VQRDSATTQRLLDRLRQQTTGQGKNPNGTDDTTPTDDQAGSSGSVIIGSDQPQPQIPRGKDLISLPPDNGVERRPREGVPGTIGGPDGNVINPDPLGETQSGPQGSSGPPIENNTDKVLSESGANQSAGSGGGAGGGTSSGNQSSSGSSGNSGQAAPRKAKKSGAGSVLERYLQYFNAKGGTTGSK
jgi:hypothetical protein